MEKPRFYLKILNGYSMSFGVQVFLDANRDREIFSQYTNGDYDNRKDLFKQFVLNENLGVLDFRFDIYHDDKYISMKWSGENGGNLGRQDCRKWIWEFNGLRNKVMARKDGDTFPTGGEVIVNR